MIYLRQRSYRVLGSRIPDVSLKVADSKCTGYTASATLLNFVAALEGAFQSTVIQKVQP
jgi:hypothetical protein